MSYSKQFLTRFKKAKAVRQQWEGLLKDAYDHFLPNRQNFGADQRGKSRVTHIFDDTAANSLQKFSNDLKNNLCPSFQKWARVSAGGKINSMVIRGQISPEEVEEIQRLLDQSTDILFEYLWQSNFDTAASESVQDMAISTGAMMVLDTGDVNNPLNFVSVPADQLVIETSPSGDIRSAWREHKVKAREIPQLFPHKKTDAKLDDIIKNSPERDLKIIEGTVYEPDTANADYHYVVYVEAADEKVIFDDYYEVSPWIIFRWNVSPSETWGRGLALQCLPTVKTLNKLVKDLLKNNSMAINPPTLMRTDSILGNPAQITLEPNSRILVKGDFGQQNNPVSYMQTGCNFNLGVGMRQEYQNQIRECFMTDSLGDVSGAVKSATEISIRHQQNVAQQTSAFGRLQQELIQKVIARCYYILQSYGLVPPQDISSADFSIKATSPLSRIQDIQDIEAITNYFGTLMQTAGEQGLALGASTLKMQALGGYLADKMQVPVELRMSAEEKQQFAEQLQQQMMNQPQQVA